MLSRFAIGDLEILGIGVSVYTLTAAEGLEAPERRVSAYDTPGEDGGVVGSALYGMRVVTLSGAVSGIDAASHEQARLDLATACRIRKDNNGFPELIRFDLTTLTGYEYFFNGFVRRFRCPVQRTALAQYQIDIVVPEPALFGITQISSGQVSRPAGGGVEYPITYPAIYGASTGGTMSLDNHGNLDSWPTITITGAVTNPVITSTTTGRSFALNYAAGTNDVIIIDMKNKTVLLNGTVSLLSAKTDESDWFLIAPGNNDLTFSTSASGDTGTAQVSFYAAYEGI